MLDALIVVASASIGLHLAVSEAERTGTVEPPKLSNIVEALGKVSRLAFFALTAFVVLYVLFRALSAPFSDSSLVTLVVVVVLSVGLGTIWLRWAFARGKKHWARWVWAGAAGTLAWVVLTWR